MSRRGYAIDLTSLAHAVADLISKRNAVYPVWRAIWRYCACGRRENALAGIGANIGHIVVSEPV
jgi:hypothetical protein